MSYTHADIQRWRAEVGRNRTAVYLDIYRKTGIHQALQQASISQASGSLGGVALYSNKWVSDIVGSKYSTQVGNIASFSIKVALGEIDFLEERLIRNTSGTITDLDFAVAAKRAWDRADLDNSGDTNSGDTQFRGHNT
jgi:hypothetical protein